MNPAWVSLPPDKWPPSARAFYRLVYIGLARAAGTSPAGKPPDATGACGPEDWDARFRP